MNSSKIVLVFILMFVSGLSGCATTGIQTVPDPPAQQTQQPQLNDSQQYWVKYYAGKNQTERPVEIQIDTPIAVEETVVEEEISLTEEPVAESHSPISPPSYFKKTEPSDSGIQSKISQIQNQIVEINQTLGTHSKRISSLNGRVDQHEKVLRMLDAKLTSQVIWDGKSDPKPMRIGSFDTGQFVLNTELQVQVVAATKRSNALTIEAQNQGKTATITIYGYSSPSKNPQNDLKLSQERANNVKMAMEKAGVKATIVAVEGKGASEEFLWKSNNQCVRIFVHIE